MSNSIYNNKNNHKKPKTMESINKMTKRQMLAKYEKARKEIMSIADKAQKENELIGKVAVHCNVYFCEDPFCSISVAAYDENDEEQLFCMNEVFARYSALDACDKIIDKVKQSLENIK